MAEINIGLKVDYQKTLDKMVGEFNAALQQISKDVKKSKFQQDMASQIEALRKEMKVLSDDFKSGFEEVNSQNVNISTFKKLQDDVEKKTESMRTKISNFVTEVNEKIGLLGGSDAASGFIDKFDKLTQSLLTSYKHVESIHGLVSTLSDSGGGISSKTLSGYKDTLNVIKDIEKEIDNLDISKIVKGKSKDDFTDELNNQVDKLKKFYKDYTEAKKQISEIPLENRTFSNETFVEADNALAKAQANLRLTGRIIKEIDSEMKSMQLGRASAFTPKFESLLDDILKSSASGIVEFEERAKKIPTTLGTIMENVNHFIVKDGSIQIPINIDEVSSAALEDKVKDAIARIQKQMDSTPVVAQIKLVLDKGSSKGYETNEEIDKQQVEGQNEPSLDITKTIQNTYRKAAREAKQIVKTEMKKVQEEFEAVPVKLKPDTELFEKEVSAMVNGTLEKIANESSGINVNKELSELVANLKEVSNALAGNENFKLGIDEKSINRITDAIKNMADMIQRAFGVASNSDIETQWGVIESKFKTIAGEKDFLPKKTKEQKAAVQELAAEYKKYLDMGGKEDLSKLTTNKDSIRKIRDEYEKLNVEVKETQDVLEQNGTEVTLTPTGETFKADAEKILDAIELEKEVKLTVEGKSIADVQDGLDKALTKAEIVQNAVNQIPQAEGTGRFIHWTSEESALAKLSNPDGIKISYGEISQFTDALGEAESSSKAIVECFDMLHHTFGDKVIVIDIPIDKIKEFTDGAKAPDFIPREYIKGVADAIDGTVKLNNEQKEVISNQDKLDDTKTTSNSNEVKEAVKNNKALATQAGKTAKALEEEGNVAHTAAERFAELAEKKKAATDANLELGIAAEMTTKALKEEMAALKEAEAKKKTNKKAVDEGTYESNASTWQNSIKQSLLDSGNYLEVYEGRLKRLESGTVRYTAFVRDSADEGAESWKKLTATISSTGEIQSTTLQEITEKQFLKMEKEKKDAARMAEKLAGEEVEPIRLSTSEMQQYSDEVNKILKDLGELSKTTYEVNITNSGKLLITRKEIAETGAEAEAFTITIDRIDDVLEESAGNMVVSASKIEEALNGAFDSARISTSTKDLASKAQKAFDVFEERAMRNSNFSQIEGDLKVLRQKISGIGSESDLIKFNQNLKDLGATLKNVEKDNKLGELFKGETRTFNNINEVRDNIDSLFASMGKVNEKSIKIKGTDKLTAEVKAANGEIRNMAVSLDSKGFARFVDNGIAQFGRLRNFAEGVFKGIQSMVRIYLSPQDFIRYFRQGLDAVKEIDTAMTELRKVSDASPGDITAYFDTAATSAKELGSSINEMIGATADWSRMGKSLPDSKELAEVAILYKNVGDNIDIEEATSSLVSTLQGFQMDAKDAIKIVDSFNEVAQ